MLHNLNNILHITKVSIINHLCKKTESISEKSQTSTTPIFGQLPNFASSKSPKLTKISPKHNNDKYRKFSNRSPGVYLVLMSWTPRLLFEDLRVNIKVEAQNNVAFAPNLCYIA